MEGSPRPGKVKEKEKDVAGQAPVGAKLEKHSVPKSQSSGNKKQAAKRKHLEDAKSTNTVSVGKASGGNGSQESENEGMWGCEFYMEVDDLDVLCFHKEAVVPSVLYQNIQRFS